MFKQRKVEGICLRKKKKESETNMKIQTLLQDIYLGALRREGFFKVGQDLSPQLTLCCFHSEYDKSMTLKFTLFPQSAKHHT